MSFFKKLFNRIAGKPEAPPEPEPEVLTPPAVEAETLLPAPEPEPASPAAVGTAARPRDPDVEAQPPDRPEPEPLPESEILAEPEPQRAMELVLEAESASAGLAPSPKSAPAVSSPQTMEEPQAWGWLQRLRAGLSKSSKTLGGSITAILAKRKLDRATLEELEDILIRSDLGLALSERIVAAVAQGRYDREIEPDEVKRILAAELARVLKPVEAPFSFGAEKPYVILVVGVNGSGKTTTIGKLGAIAAREGFKVMLAACDTFRAAAIEQLTVWGGRIGARTLSRPAGSDPAGLAFDAFKEARSDGTDILFIDTAGRLQNKANLMAELDKLVRVLSKQDPSAPHAVLLVLDATTGQNAISQAAAFIKVAGVTGVIMTKLDGTARGGILAAIAERFKLPVHAIGIGEGIDDLQPFDADAFARAIAGLDR